MIDELNNVAWLLAVPDYIFDGVRFFLIVSVVGNVVLFVLAFWRLSDKFKLDDTGKPLPSAGGLAGCGCLLLLPISFVIIYAFAVLMTSYLI